MRFSAEFFRDKLETIKNNEQNKSNNSGKISQESGKTTSKIETKGKPEPKKVIT